MVIVYKRYLPYIEDWNESGEYPRKEIEQNHSQCESLVQISKDKFLCTRRNVIVVKSELHCRLCNII